MLKFILKQYIFLQFPEELTLDYAEITSIPPLPLWTLLAAEKETAATNEDGQVSNHLINIIKIIN